MIRRLKHQTLVRIEDIKPSSENLKVVGVFNPAAERAGDEIYLLARVAEAFIQDRDGYFSSPRYVFDSKTSNIEYKSFPIKYDHNGDTRKFEDESGFMRLAFISHLRLVKLDSTGFEVKMIDPEPSFFPEYEYEEFGVEDPRLTKLNDKYYFTYVAVSKEMGVATALASTKDFVNFERHGIIFCCENKDVVLLPEKFNGRYCAYHRPVSDHKFTSPNMQCAFSPDLIHWGDHRKLMGTRNGRWDSERMGAGPPPVKTDRGWLEIYHGVELVPGSEPVGIYRAGAALFDLNDPSKLIARSKEPVISPEDPDETAGFVRNVIFPTGIVMEKDNKTLLLFSGGADSVITVTRMSVDEIFDTLEYL